MQIEGSAAFGILIPPKKKEETDRKIQVEVAIENRRRGRKDATSSASFFPLSGGKVSSFSQLLQTLWRAIIRFTCPERANTGDERVGALICWNLWLSDKLNGGINSRDADVSTLSLSLSPSLLCITLDQFLSRMRDSFVLDLCMRVYIYIGIFARWN